MKTKIRYWIDLLRETFWFVPLLFTVSSVLLAAIMCYLDSSFEDWIVGHIPGMTMEADTALAILSTITSAMFTVAGIVFSITFVTLSIASSQLGPRLMRTFMRNTSTHVALGFFIGTGTYSLLVLAASRAADDVRFVPGLSVMTGVFFCVSSMLVLILFIHSVARLVQAPNVVQQVAGEVDAAIDRLYPKEVRSNAAPPLAGADIDAYTEEFGEVACTVQAKGEGYLEAVDTQGLIDFAASHDLILRACYRPGHFVSRGTVLALVWGGRTGEVKGLEKNVNKAFILGARPTPHQDVEGAVAELVEVAVRALSPSMNDPFTAIHCIDYLGAALGRLAQRETPSPLHFDPRQNLRLILPRPEFPNVLAAGFNPIREYGGASVPVIVRMLESLAVIARVLQRDEDRAEVRRQGSMILRLAERTVQEPEDMKDVQERFENLAKALVPTPGVEALP